MLVPVLLVEAVACALACFAAVREVVAFGKTSVSVRWNQEQVKRSESDPLTLRDHLLFLLLFAFCIFVELLILLPLRVLISTVYLHVFGFIFIFPVFLALLFVLIVLYVIHLFALGIIVFFVMGNRLGGLRRDDMTAPRARRNAGHVSQTIEG
ncbi:hypothetical protein BD324DRAFT_294561 [Kockovaella imperatae]|uniref:Transmembrane protein n=1 Tax=Kockovaella imperatae TaxID=4999 RepID=A0A1Y1ULC9_9TREE|nr:hypothetical protein BD324DRAFT_294561 [Kockovaella imperatae]ORX38858.1 hypothetical protein BD324DRAFT_294561 [Kockovaella imperatae]